MLRRPSRFSPAPTVPFTLAHPAAVIPLRRYGDLAALVIGSMLPDFGYFLGLSIPRHYSHSVVGLFALCLPLGLVAYTAYYTLLREPLIALAPEGLARRLTHPHPLPRTRRQWVLICNAILIGALTHLLWDEFTHASWRQGQLFPWLSAEFFVADEMSLRPIDVLSYLSTVIGIGLITRWAIGWWYATAPANPIPVGLRMHPGIRIAVFAIAAIGIAVFMLMAARGDSEEDGPFALAAGAGLRALVIAIIVYAAAWQLLRRLAPQSKR